jgi:hypothetical protein
MSDLLTKTGADFSPCRTWRYRLWRTWDPGAYPLVFVMLNPSKADEDSNDQTVERCERRARAGKYGGLVVLNLFAFCATDPRDMKAAADAVGPDNDEHLRRALDLGTRPGHQGGAERVYDPMIVAAWGIHGAHQGRDREVLAMARTAGVQLHCLGTTAKGHPKHPLYLSYDTPLQPWSLP